MATLHVHEYGDPAGRPLVALHGVTGHGARWRRLATEHLPGFRVLALDLRGHGRSPWTPPWTLEQHTADVLDTLDALGLDHVPVLAHSFGGAVALHLSRLAPERVARLVLLDPAIGLPPEQAAEQADLTVGLPMVFADPEDAVAAQRARWSGLPLSLVEEEVAEHLERVEGAPDAGGGPGTNGHWRWRFRLAAVVTAWSEMARPHVVPPAGTPTLLVAARGADFVQLEFVQDCRSVLGEELVATELDCGHMVYLERAEEVGTLVRDFLGA